MFIATAEKLYRDHRNDVAFDFSPVVIDFAKAFEVQVNMLLRQALLRAKPQERMSNLDGRSVDLTKAGPFSLGELAVLIGEKEEINRLLKRLFAQHGGEWFTASLPTILKHLAAIRNPSAHPTAPDRHEVHALRNRFLTVGCEGDFVKLAKVRVI